MITITVNGESQTCQENLSLPRLLESLGYNPRLVAVEYNGEILHRQDWEKTIIKQGDKLEVVTIVGGG
ncbi:MAG: sulfur carrier protein ThiS [Geminocystis sp.]|nr:sulfur carrier protein ThiS [Geminocystis sp.]HIK37628.1 thiamine biosynthesis protein ThiS [Geminocystis sp. M7585_C2015_104]MCS7148151.1 sulfur carrier protein ThiS [Geminocystis sp.]MCX8078104.1 sulfur carrier protein ThiS [Geminocystis sp.]MDW8116502.1 sulfur carrier protein ThiS [Geminocystis sp.]